MSQWLISAQTVASKIFGSGFMALTSRANTEKSTCVLLVRGPPAPSERVGETHAKEATR